MDNHHAAGSSHSGQATSAAGPANVWPLFAALSALCLGVTLLWWSNSDDSSLAGPLLAASLVATLVAAVGWIFEDTRARRHAAAQTPGSGDASRYTQVITFAVAEGKLEAARASDGVIGLIESADAGLRTLAGFRDLRIVASPAATGPSQVLVETSWSNREGLATYEETRRTVLDTLSGAEQQVVPGSVQVFDMVVVRDTKDVAVRFTPGTAATLLGSLAVGGLLVGAGLTIFEDDNGGGGGAVTPVPTGFAATGSIIAKDIKFKDTAISLPPNTEVTIRLDNQDASPPHNIQFFAGAETSGALLAGCTAGCPSGDVATAISPGPVVQEFTFTTPGVGEYAFDCVVHPDQMKGILTIAEGVPLPGSGGGAPAGGESTDTIVGKGTKFQTTEIRVKAETEVTLKFDNQDASPPHNIQFFAGPETSGPLLTGCTAGCPSGDVATEIATGPVVQEFTFTTPKAGQYAYNCLVHPNDMKGVMIVE